MRKKKEKKKTTRETETETETDGGRDGGRGQRQHTEKAERASELSPATQGTKRTA